jgi:hypothetical protein
MTPSEDSVFHLFHIGLLRAASLLVPAKQRAEWWREWHAELWHVRHACAPQSNVSREGEQQITAFCLGAFQDALCLRQQCWQTREPHALLQGSATRCILSLGAVLAASYVVALLLPGVRAAHILPSHQVNPGLIRIQNTGYDDDSSPTILPRQYRAWKRNRQQYFDGFAFYGVTQEPVEWVSASTGSNARAGWEVARASSNLFVLLRLPVQFTEPDTEGAGNMPKVILSEGIWKREFGANPHVAGSMVRLGLQNARIAGVAPDGSSGLPGKVDVWLLEPDSAIVSESVGYVIARLTALGESEMWRQCVPITVYNSDQPEDDLLGVSLDAGTPDPWSIYLFTVFLAFLALPATTSVSLGEYAVCSHKPSWTKRLYRWGFLSAKIAFILPIVYFISLDLAYGRTAFDAPTAVYIQLISSFSICLFGLNWALRDQRQRCPVCLRAVAHPAQVGQASRTFLAWNGTELMCVGGHTLLHVPGLPTSWFSTQRWLYLDASWSFLFAGSGTAMEHKAITGFSSP